MHFQISSVDGWSGIAAADCIRTTLAGPRIWNARDLAQRWRQWVLRHSFGRVSYDSYASVKITHLFLGKLIANRLTNSALPSIFQNVLFWFSIESFMSAPKTKSVRIRFGIVTRNSQKMKLQYFYVSKQSRSSETQTFFWIKTISYRNRTTKGVKIKSITRLSLPKPK